MHDKIFKGKNIKEEIKETHRHHRNYLYIFVTSSHSKIKKRKQLHNDDNEKMIQWNMNKKKLLKISSKQEKKLYKKIFHFFMEELKIYFYDLRIFITIYYIYNAYMMKNSIN